VLHLFVFTECILAKRCILEQKLLLTAYWKSYEKSIGNKKEYDLNLLLEIVSKSSKLSTIASYSTMHISETVRDGGLVPKHHQQEMAYVESNGHVIYDVT